MSDTRLKTNSESIMQSIHPYGDVILWHRIRRCLTIDLDLRVATQLCGPLVSRTEMHPASGVLVV